jgi:uncharacterized membrane protein
MLAFSSTRINYVRIERNKWQSQRTPFHAFKDILSTRHIWRGTRLRNSHENSLENTAVHDVQEQSNSHSKEKEIIVTSTIKLPFSAHTAFDAFSDLTRQPTWSHWLKSVQYIHGDGDPSYPTTKWTLGWRGFTFSWIAKSTKLVRPHVIEWESISGLKNRGTVKFVELNGSHSKEDHKTEMELTLIFMTPRIVSTMFHNSGRIKSMIETSVIQKTLVNFRDVVIQQDLKG